jgi:hypothetical protein
MEVLTTWNGKIYQIVSHIKWDSDKPSSILELIEGLYVNFSSK